MPRLLLILVALYYSAVCYAQKPALDTSVFRKWPSVEAAAISNDGKYLVYSIREGTLFEFNTKLILQSSNAGWKLEIPGVANAQITQDSRFAVFTKSTDSLGIVNLDSSSVQYITQVGSYIVPKEGDGQFIIYQTNNVEKELVIRNLKSGEQKYFKSVKGYYVSDDGKVCVLLTESNKDGTSALFLNLITMGDNNVNTIWSEVINEKEINLSNVIFDKNNSQVAFIIDQKTGNRKGSSIWHYKTGMDKAVLLVDNQTVNIDSGLVLGSIQKFSNDGERLFISLREMSYPKSKADAVKVNVWSHADVSLQSYQLKNQSPQRYTAILNIADHRIIRIEEQNEALSQAYLDTTNNGLITLSRKMGGGIDISESNWNPALQKPVYLISTKDGQRKNLDQIKSSQPYLSAEGRFIIYYNADARNYFSYEILSGITKNITKDIKTNWSVYEDDHVDASRSYYRPAGWIKGDKALLLYDQHDIWQVDPTCQTAPVNVTNGYGLKHNLFFEVIRDGFKYPFSVNEKIILSVYNLKTKDNGFSSKNLSVSGDPTILSMGKYFYYASIAAKRAPDGVNFNPIKARDAEVYIVRRMSSSESPNFFSTTDFKTFIPLSNIYPEREYNWFKTELHSWKSSDGTTIQGLLYKPENFDPTKKYPIIFYVYEIQSNGLNAYLKPAPSGGWLNIPWYVSNGYLVFAPDVHFKNGDVGESVLKVVKSSVNYLSKIPFVDVKKMGFQGISFGGIQANYIATHTKMFSAICSASGISNFISGYGSLKGNGSSLQSIYEEGQTRVGATLWQRPDLYIKNSSVLLADKVTSPLLMFHTTHDEICPFPNAIEFFTALRRLEKKVWMLEYEEGNHNVSGKSADDFNIRMQQFFNHYLKSAPPPIWLSQGIPAKLKSITTGYPLDPSGTCSPTCPICLSWNTKMKKDSLSTLQEIQTRTLTNHWQ